MDPGQPKNRLLVVDGDAKNLRVLDVSLKKAGFDVATATSGREALTLLESNKPDLIISDTDLDEMDGFELCSQVKGRAAWAKIPFIFVSGRKSIEDKIRGLELGVDDYLTKPIYIKEIGIRVRTALQRAERERMESRREGRTRFAGDLSDVGVVDLVQTIELNRKSGIIHIVNRDSRRGSIFFRDGKVIDAEVGRLVGAHALYRLFSWQDGQFTVEFKQIRRHDTISMPMAALLMEGMRRLDESAHLFENLPSPRSVLEVDCRVLADELAELPDEMNSVLRLCDGARTLLEVVEDSEIPDLEVLGILHKLLADQIIFAREVPERGGESETNDRLARWLSEGGTEDGIVAEETAPGSGDILVDGESLPAVTPPPASLADKAAPKAPAGPAQFPARLASKPSEPRRTSPLGSPLSLDLDLDAALSSQIVEEIETATGPRRISDTLRGVPVESLLGEHEPGDNAPAPQAASPATSDAASNHEEAPHDPRSTKPLGLAERLLSEDSVVRGGALREGMGEASGRITNPQPTATNTREYGEKTAQAAALVYEIVASSHGPKPEAPPAPIQPERPSKEVDWGPWSTQTTQGAPAEHASGSAPLPSFPEASSLASLSVDEPKDGVRGKTLANPPSAEAKPQLEVAPSIEETQPSQTQQASGTGASWPDTGISGLQPSAADDPVTAKSSRSIQEALTPDPLPEEITLKQGRVGRAWVVALVGFVAGVAGYLIWASATQTPDEEDSLSESAPAQIPVEQAPPLPTPVAPAAPTPAAEPQATEGQAPAEAAPAPKAAEATSAQTTATETEAPSPNELRQKCLQTDADGKGKSRAVLAACKPALAANPNAADVLLILARNALDRGRIGEGRSLAKQALAADPKLAEGYIYLGNAEIESGNTDKARTAYKKYLELAPTGRFAREMRAVLENM